MASKCKIHWHKIHKKMCAINEKEQQHAAAAVTKIYTIIKEKSGMEKYKRIYIAFSMLVIFKQHFMLVGNVCSMSASSRHSNSRLLHRIVKRCMLLLLSIKGEKSPGCWCILATMLILMMTVAAAAAAAAMLFTFAITL